MYVIHRRDNTKTSYIDKMRQRSPTGKEKKISYIEKINNSKEVIIQISFTEIEIIILNENDDNEDKDVDFSNEDYVKMATKQKNIHSTTVSSGDTLRNIAN